MFGGGNEEAKAQKPPHSGNKSINDKEARKKLAEQFRLDAWEHWL